jgi:phytoene desaturase
LAKAGFSVTVLEQHNIPGGRARKLEANGFTFDMGPSWYWMPDVFERFFNLFNKKVSDYYTLKRLDPSYTIFWENGKMDIPSNLEELKNLFEGYEKGAAKNLELFLEEAKYKYEVGINKLVFKPGNSITEFADWEVIKGVVRLDVFTNMKKHVGKYFTHPKLKQLLEFPVLFLGAMPQNIPALYSLMNYADIVGGTWFPKGGMYSIVEGMFSLAKELGVVFKFNEKVTGFTFNNNKITAVNTKNNSYAADVVLGGADYHHIETTLLPTALQSYSTKYWDERVMAPSCLLYYVGINKKLENLQHHTLFFDTSFEVHGNEIYTSKTWPKNPLFYMSATSVTDEHVAPEGCENLFFLIPIAAGLQGDTEEIRDKYFDMIVARAEQKLQQTIRPHIIYKKSYAVKDFVNDYGAFKGNAYGLANTLMQTSILKPSCKSKKVENLFYTGQLTVPGPGVPPSLISGEVLAKEILRYSK